MGGGGPIRSLHEHKNLLVVNEQDIHMSSKNYEGSSYGLKRFRFANDLVLIVCFIS